MLIVYYTFRDLHVLKDSYERNIWYQGLKTRRIESKMTYAQIMFKQVATLKIRNTYLHLYLGGGYGYRLHHAGTINWINQHLYHRSPHAIRYVWWLRRGAWVHAVKFLRSADDTSRVEAGSGRSFDLTSRTLNPCIAIYRSGRNGLMHYFSHPQIPTPTPNTSVLSITSSASFLLKISSTRHPWWTASCKLSPLNPYPSS